MSFVGGFLLFSPVRTNYFAMPWYNQIKIKVNLKFYFRIPKEILNTLRLTFEFDSCYTLDNVSGGKLIFTYVTMKTTGAELSKLIKFGLEYSI